MIGFGQLVTLALPNSQFLGVTTTTTIVELRALVRAKLKLTNPKQLGPNGSHRLPKQGPALYSMRVSRVYDTFCQRSLTHHGRSWGASVGMMAPWSAPRCSVTSRMHTGVQLLVLQSCSSGWILTRSNR